MNHKSKPDAGSIETPDVFSDQNREEKRVGTRSTASAIPAIKATDAVERVPTRTDSAASRRHGTVLVVDDIPANRTLLRETLEPKGYEVLLAGNGETTRKIARRAKPDAILLDVNMPGMDGFETCRLNQSTNPPIHYPFLPFLDTGCGRALMSATFALNK